MNATLTWLDLTATDRDQMRRVLDLFHEKETIDEMGLGSLRDAFSNRLFPGTSTIQTRLRYFLFIPWIYQQLQKRNISASQIRERSRSAEINLIGKLLQSDDPEGTIGGRARSSLARLPSSIYWSGLVQWGIFSHPQSQSWYHTNFERLRNRGQVIPSASDDPGVLHHLETIWHPRLPNPPSSFPAEARFALKRNEASFLQSRIEEKCAGTLLAWFAREGVDTPANGCFWDDRTATSKAGVEIRDTIELARRFSLQVEGIPLLYNLLLAERLRDYQNRKEEHRDRDEEWVERYRTEFSKWAIREATEPNFDIQTLWSFTASIGNKPHPRQKRFVENWSKRIVEVDPIHAVNDEGLRTLVAKREKALKKNRARLVNDRRLLYWNGEVGVGRMDFRWRRVHQLLWDLHLGLAS